MRRQQDSSDIRLRSFGSLTGLIFERGGYAEIQMTRFELCRIVDAWRAHERAKNNPDEKLLAALNVVSKKSHSRFKAAMVAEVPIAMWRAEIVPIIRTNVSATPKTRRLRSRLMGKLAFLPV